VLLHYVEMIPFYTQFNNLFYLCTIDGHRWLNAVIVQLSLVRYDWSNVFFATPSYWIQNYEGS